MTTTTIALDALDQKLAAAFPGRVVRKDLVRNVKTGFNVPVYVLEYLLGKYCSSTDHDIVADGLTYVKQTLAENYVRADESEKIKSITRERRTHKIIDKVKVRLVETEDKYWAELINMGIKYVNVPEGVVRQYDKLLAGGIWAIINLRYDADFQHRGQTRPFIIENLKPIQQPSTDFSDLFASRAHFTRDEWLDALLRSVGLEPTHPDFDRRKKLLTVMRLVPMVESNYNLIELGPRGTGKSFVYREISPYTILISGGQTTVAQLFIHLGTGRIGLVGLWDVVAFDEVAGVRFKDPNGIQILKDYMESGSFSRGKEEVPADASIVFNGNIDADIASLLKTSHLFQPLSPHLQNMAFIDRLHFYLPGWDLRKMQPEYLTDHYGFVVDYITEVWRELRKTSYSDAIDRYFSLGSHLNQRDVRAVRKTVSGLIKMLHPDGEFTRDELQEYLELALEGRRRVKEQLKKMGGLEYWAVNFSYLDNKTHQETFVVVPEQGGGGLIPPGQPNPGVVFTVGTDRDQGRHAIFRIETQALKGRGGTRVTGAPSRAMRDAIQTAYTFLRGHSRQLGISKDPNEYDFHVQIVNLMQSKEGSETGVAFFIAMLSALLDKPVLEQSVVLGEMSIHGSLLKVPALAERLQLAMDNGAKRVLIPSENKRDFADIPSDVLDKLQIIFFSDPVNAAFRAMGLE
ncbi:MAG: protease Lon-related BREX system protein BrxL [Chloroflexota bacterium]|nr:protease Lon-related BREX system protein BrxL [Chloroflexota bacterium]